MFKLIIFISLIEILLLAQFGLCMYYRGCKSDSCEPRPTPAPYRPPPCQTCKPPNYCDEVSVPIKPVPQPICFSEKLYPHLMYQLSLAQRFDELQKNFFCRQCNRFGTSCPKGCPVDCTCLS